VAAVITISPPLTVKSPAIATSALLKVIAVVPPLDLISLPVTVKSPAIATSVLDIVIAVDPALPLMSLPDTCKSPVITNSSSIVTVPVALSNVKPPDAVSISLSLVIPTRILPAVTPANVGLAVVS